MYSQECYLILQFKNIYVLCILNEWLIKLSLFRCICIWKISVSKHQKWMPPSCIHFWCFETPMSGDSNNGVLKLDYLVTRKLLFGFWNSTLKFWNPKFVFQVTEWSSFKTPFLGFQITTCWCFETLIFYSVR